MNKSVAAVLVVVVIGGVTASGVAYYFQSQERRELLTKVLTMQEELSTTKSNLLGYTKYLDYMTVSKSALTGQMKFLAAKVDRDYIQVEHIQKSVIGLKANSTILINYKVEYPCRRSSPAWASNCAKCNMDLQLLGPRWCQLD